MVGVAPTDFIDEPKIPGLVRGQAGRLGKRLEDRAAHRLPKGFHSRDDRCRASPASASDWGTEIPPEKAPVHSLIFGLLGTLIIAAGISFSASRDLSTLAADSGDPVLTMLSISGPNEDHMRVLSEF